MSVETKTKKNVVAADKKFYSKLEEVIELENSAEELHKKAKEKFFEAVTIAREAGYDDFTISCNLTTFFEHKLERHTIAKYNKLLLPEKKDDIEQSTSQSGNDYQNDSKNDTEQTSISEVQTYTSRLNPPTQELGTGETPVLITHDDHNQQKSVPARMEEKGFNFSNNETQIFKGNNKHILEKLDKLPGSVWIVVVQEVIDSKAQENEEEDLSDD